MACSNNENNQNNDIEDTIPTPRDFVDFDIYRRVVYNMIKTEINSINDMKMFIRQQQKECHIALIFHKILYVYRTMIRDKMIERHQHYEQFLKSKTVREDSGVTVVTVLTSPWPKTVEENYGIDVEGDVHKADTFEKPELTKTLAAQNKMFSCRYDCFYCPAEEGQPRSYIKKEPAVARANQHRFDAIAQFNDRGNSYIINGQSFDKIELIVLGGTWSSYPSDYQEEFITDLYYAANTFYNTIKRDKFTLEEEIRNNENSMCRIIGLTLETRPDQVNPQELIRYRRFGVTRVQIGVQHTDDAILKYVNRGCTTADTLKAIKLLKDNCFKVDIHLMPDLPSSNVDKDRLMFHEVLNNPGLSVDQFKIYPLIVMNWTKIQTWYNNEINNYDCETNPLGLKTVDNRRYKSYAETPLKNVIKMGKSSIPSTPLIELLIDVKSKIPPWVRINRLVRDIPGVYINGGNDRENLRQLIHKEMATRGLACNCIRCREVKGKKTQIENSILVVRKYPASGGWEYFISFESPDYKTIYGFLRLRINNSSNFNNQDNNQNNTVMVFDELKNTALIRELHVYGKVVPVTRINTMINENKGDNVNKNDGVNKDVQHMGFGKRLIQKAEEIAYNCDFRRIAVISGVGVRNYYRKQGYLDSQGLGNFQIKILDVCPISEIYFTPKIVSPNLLPTISTRILNQYNQYIEIFKENQQKYQQKFLVFILVCCLLFLSYRIYHMF